MASCSSLVRGVRLIWSGAGLAVGMLGGEGGGVGGGEAAGGGGGGGGGGVGAGAGAVAGGSDAMGCSSRGRRGGAAALGTVGEGGWSSDGVLMDGCSVGEGGGVGCVGDRRSDA